jgi:hypothetical protein
MPNKKKQTKRKKSAKKTTPKRKVAPKRAPSKQTTPKKSVKKATPKKKVARKKTISMRSLARKTKFSAKRRRLTSTGLVVQTVPLRSGERREHLDGQAGDLQAISNRPTANSESVEELLEEGNALEAEAVQGVENALDADQGEVRTNEVPEDDVPEEYLDKKDR